MSRRAWSVAYYVLLAVFILTAALNMLKMRGGFFTNHAADVVVPAWLYIVARSLHTPTDKPTLIRRTIGRNAGDRGDQPVRCQRDHRVQSAHLAPRRLRRTVRSVGCAFVCGGVGVVYAVERTWPVDRTGQV